MNNFVFLLVIALCGCATSLNVESKNRIAGGSTVTDANQFRYMISLQQKNQGNAIYRGHRCGGALVGLRHAVTAASCLYNNVNGVHTILNAADYRVFAGGLVLTEDSDADRVRDVERFTVHPNYQPGTPYVNDIAVITLASAFPSSSVQPLSLRYVDDPAAIVTCTSSGWGSQNNTESASIQLMHMQQHGLAANSDCQTFYSNPLLGEAITLHNSMICAVVTVGASSCAGDLGNPLVCGGHLTGVLVYSGANNCQAPVVALQPEIYARISNVREWVQTTAGANTFQPAMALLAVITIFQITLSRG